MHPRWFSRQISGPSPVITFAIRPQLANLVEFQPQSSTKKTPTSHTLGAYPRHPYTPKCKEFLHKLLVGGLGYVPGVCWKILRSMEFCLLSPIARDTGMIRVLGCPVGLVRING